MPPEDSPFPCYWWDISLEGLGLGTVRPNVCTYGRYDFAKLPPLPFQMRGQLDCQAATSSYDWNIGEEKAGDNARAIAALRASCESLGLSLPPALTKFFETLSLQDRIRSSTDCYLDGCPATVQFPLSGGHLIRFLADSQGCLFWYLYLTEDRLDHAVVCSPGFYGTEPEQWQDQEPDASDLVFCAESFETFICRFWIENEIWFAWYEKDSNAENGARLHRTVSL
jgi:hypothetical protein